MQEQCAFGSTCLEWLSPLHDSHFKVVTLNDFKQSTYRQFYGAFVRLHLVNCVIFFQVFPHGLGTASRSICLVSERKITSLSRIAVFIRVMFENLKTKAIDESSVTNTEVLQDFKQFSLPIAACL